MHLAELGSKKKNLKLKFKQHPIPQCSVFVQCLFVHSCVVG